MRLNPIVTAIGTYWDSYWANNPILYDVLEAWGEFYLIVDVMQGFRDAEIATQGDYPYSMTEYLNCWSHYDPLLVIQPVDGDYYVCLNGWPI